MNKNHILILLVYIFALSANCLLNKEANQQPNVVVIMTDDQGYADMSCHGNPYLKTPNIDKLHDNSVNMTDFHVDPTCAPTRANDIPESRAWMYGMLASVDENIDSFRSFLQSNELDENTILIFLTDNGTSGGVSQQVRQMGNKYEVTVKNGYNAGMRGKKGDPYEGGHRATCLIHWQAGGINTHRNVERIAAQYDLLPTLIDMAGLSLILVPSEKGHFDSRKMHDPCMIV